MISIKEEKDDNVNGILDDIDGDENDDDGRREKIDDDFYSNEASGIETEYGNILPDKEDRSNSILLYRTASKSKDSKTNLMSKVEAKATIENLSDSNFGIHNNDVLNLDLNPSEPLGKYQCFLCPLNFATKLYLSKHLVKHFDSRRPYMCQVCEKNFSKMDGLKTHINCCADIRPYQCEQCDKAFTTSSKLCKHRRTTHSGISPLNCTKCDYKTFERNNLNNHMAIHMDERPFKCNYCSYSSKSQKYLTAHERIHTDDKRYKCDTCYSRFVQPQSLRDHRKKHFLKGLIFHQCCFCPSELYSPDELRKHVENLHRDEVLK